MCDNSFSFCTCIAIILGLIAAAVLAVLFYFGIVPLLGEILPIVFTIIAISIFTLIVFTIVSLFSHYEDVKKCICCYGVSLLISAILTLVIAIIASSITLAVGSIASAVILFLLILFLSILIYYGVSLLGCIIDSVCPHCPKPRE